MSWTMAKHILIKMHFIKKKNSISIDVVDVNKIMLFNKTSYGNKRLS